ncbi:hypothetical protein [Nocardia mangyaensis]|uniref:hypothetical protein n=1 Tax=Nocardia mangyaensis TaxID=2213200 RepID=UPI0026752465|nr:hypothetical protein [Nocardia mangyaensis]MDO3647292.1 hypothetical protein [Nocardia mangyaensis]
MGETSNPWSGLKSDSLNGALELQPGVIDGLVNAAIDVRVRINGVKKHLGKVDQLDPFAEVIPSAEALASRFAAKGRDLGGVLDDHLTILDDMSDTFLAAGKAYTGTDEGGQADFATLREKIEFHEDLHDSLSPRPDVTSLFVTQPERVPGILDSPNGGLPASLASPEGLEFDSAIVHAEDPAQFSYSQYQQIRKSIVEGSPTTPVMVSQAAADWHWLAGELKSAFDTLSNKMISSESSWRSPSSGGGAERARAAIAAYGTGNDNLVSSMNALGDALVYVSVWLHTTGIGLTNAHANEVPLRPPESVAAYEARKNDVYQKIYVGVMNGLYVPGVDHTSGVIAVLPDPIPPTTGTPPSEVGPGGTGSGSTGGSGSGSGSGSQSAGLSSAFQSGMSALQTAAAQTAAQTAEQAAANEAAKAAAQAAAEQAAAQAAAEQASSALQSGLEQAGTALQSGLEQASSAAESALQQANAAAQQGALSAVPGLAGVNSALDQAKKAMSAASRGGGGGGGAGAGGGAGLPQTMESSSRLFPRAALATGAESGFRAGIAGAGVGNPMGGMPMGGMPMGGAGAGGGQQQKEHKRADYLDSVEHLDEALGDAPIVARPVVEQ